MLHVLFTLPVVWVENIMYKYKTGLIGYLFYRKTCKAVTHVTYSSIEIATFQLFFQL